MINQLIAESDDRDLQLMYAEPFRLTWWLADLRNPDSVQLKKDPAFTYSDMALDDASKHLSKISLYRLFPNSLRDPQKVADSHPLATGGENLASTLRDMMQKKSLFLPELKEALPSRSRESEIFE